MGYQNFFATRLATDIGSSDTTITLETAPSEVEGRLVLEARNSTKREIISYTGVSGNDITGVTRGIGGTSATDHLKNSLVEMNVTAEDLQDIIDAFDSFAASNSNGWTDSIILPTAVTYLGQRSYQLTYNSSIAAIKSVGMRTRFNRTVVAPTQCADLELSSSHYFSKASPAGTTFTDDFVVGAWVKLESYGGGNDMTIISRYNGTSGWRFSVDANTGTVTLWGYNGGSTNYSIVRSYQALPLGRWVHVSAQLDMSAFTQTATTSFIMFDGVEVPSAVARAGTNPTALVQAGDLQIGRDNTTDYFDGKIAQVFYSSAKITQANIRTLISQGITAALVTTHSIVSAYSLSNSVTDINTTNANNLTAQNSVTTTTADSPFGTQADGTIDDELEYAITTAISTNGLTETVQVPEGCALPTSGGIDAVSYSPHKTPYGFPAATGRWEVLTLINTQASHSYSGTNTWEVFGVGTNLVVPVGHWNIGYKGTVQASSSVSGVRDQHWLIVSSTPTNGTYRYPRAVRLYTQSASEVIKYLNVAYKSEVSSAETFVLYSGIGSSTGTETGRIGANNTPFYMFAEFALL